jgi:hypothetical protein
MQYVADKGAGSAAASRFQSERAKEREWFILKDFCRFLTDFSQLYLLHWGDRPWRFVAGRRAPFVGGERAKGEWFTVGVHGWCSLLVFTVGVHGWCAVGALLVHGCFTVVSRLVHGWCTVVSRLFHGCFTVVSRLFHGCFTVVSRLFHGWCTVVSRLFHGCSSDIGPMYGADRLIEAFPLCSSGFHLVFIWVSSLLPGMGGRASWGQRQLEGPQGGQCRVHAVRGRDRGQSIPGGDVGQGE